MDGGKGSQSDRKGDNRKVKRRKRRGTDGRK